MGKLEIICVQIFQDTNNTINILAAYNPGDSVTNTEFNYYINALGNNFIILGDFNAHSPLLDGKYHRNSNVTGTNLENILLEKDVILCNPADMATFVDYKTGKSSCLDLCLVSPNLAPSITVTRGDDMGSDHCAILVELRQKPYRCQQSSIRKWVTKDVDWMKWKLNIPIRTLHYPTDLESMSTDLISRYNESAKSFLKQTSGKTHTRLKTPWWNQSCKVKIQQRKQTRRRCEKHPTLENIQDLRRHTAEARYQIVKSKRNSWKNYVSTLTPDTPISKVWEKIKKIKSTYKPQLFPIYKNNVPLFDNYSKAEAFAEHYAKSFKQENSIKIHPRMDEVIERGKENNIDSSINDSITRKELEIAIQSLKSSAPGHDTIPNEFFKNSTSEINFEILQIFNTSWHLSIVPKTWKQGIMIPIIKPRKSKEDVTSYRPITLLPTLGKLMEKIGALRLNFYMETNNLYGSHQCGFRKTYSTNDVFLRLEKDIRETIYNNKTMVVVPIPRLERSI